MTPLKELRTSYPAHHAGHLRVSHRHGNHDQPDDNAGDQIVAQPGALVRCDPADEGDVAL